MSSPKQYLSFNDFVPEIKLTKKNDKFVHVSEYVQKRLRKYKTDNNLRSDSHAVHSLIVLNQMLVSIMSKLDNAIKTAMKKGNPDFVIAVLYDNASPQEKAMFDLIWRGALF